MIQPHGVDYKVLAPRTLKIQVLVKLGMSRWGVVIRHGFRHACNRCRECEGGKIRPYLLVVGASIALVLALVAAAQPIMPFRGGLVINILSTNGSLIGIAAYGHNLVVSHVVMRLIEPNQNYLVVAYSFNVTQGRLIEYIGYTYVNGSMLLRVIAGGSAVLYSWVRSNIVLKPLNQYPRANVTVIVKAPNGEPVSNGTVCALLAPPVFLPLCFHSTRHHPTVGCALGSLMA
jgi:hypothetical protein